jgi:hypothetical protein
VEEEILALALIVALGVVSISVLLYLDATSRKRARGNPGGEVRGRNTTQ